MAPPSREEPAASKDQLLVERSVTIEARASDLYESERYQVRVGRWSEAESSCQLSLRNYLLPSSLSVLADYRKTSVGDRCVRKKRNCVTLSIHFRKNMFSNFWN